MKPATLLTISVVCLWISQSCAQPSSKSEDNTTVTEPTLEEIPPTLRFDLILEGGWDPFYITKFTVDPVDDVSILVIPVENGANRLPARFNATFNIPDPPEGCPPNETLWYSRAVYYEKLCLERDWQGKCTMPGKDGFTNKTELVEHYDDLPVTVFNYEVNIPDISYLFTKPTEEEIRALIQITKTLEGVFCYDDRDYWIAFQTSCHKPIEIEVGIKSTTIVEKWECRGFNHFMIAQHGGEAFLKSRVFWTIIIPFGYFAFLFLLLLACCTCFDFGAKGKVSSLLKVNLSFDFGFSDDEDESARKKSSQGR